MPIFRRFSISSAATFNAMFQINGSLLIFFAVYQDCCLSAIGLATFGGEKIANQLAMTPGHIWLLPEIVERLRKSNPHNCSFHISRSLVDHLAFLFSFIDYISQR